LRLLEQAQGLAPRAPLVVREGDSGSSATPVPHGAIGAYDVDDALDAETLDAIAVGMVSPEGIVPARDEPASRGVPENVRGEPSRATRGLVSPEGIEPATNRLRVVGRAIARRRRS